MDITFEPINLTKELILSRVSEERILSHYLGLPIKKGLYRNPLRQDAKPTASFFKSKTNGRIMFKDFGTGYCGDFVSIVMTKFNCSYYKALQIIANDFGIIKRQDLPKNKCLKKWDEEKFEDTGGAIIQVEIKDFTENDLQWWAKYGISQSTLKKFRVYSCKNVFLNGNLFEMVSDNQYVYGYYGGIKQDIEQWRIYHPKKNKFKWISNWKGSYIQGAKQLSKAGGDLLIIQKSLKDVMCLYEFGIQSIAPCSENLFVSNTVLIKLKKKYKRIIVWYDTDIPGINNLRKIKKEHPELEYFFIPRKYNVKDFSDFRKKYGRDKSEKFLNSYIKCIKE